MHDRIILYRAIGERELNDLLRFGDYGPSPNSFGKYFAFTLAGVQQFAGARINLSRRMTTTSIEIPASLLLGEDALPALYRAARLPRIVDAPWAPRLGKG
jgi:hypothetical protein